jgi:3-polyprenyl-4-hydroxybenzoate decarboxylase
MVLDATRKPHSQARPSHTRKPKRLDFKSLDRRILDVRLVDDCLLLVKTSRDGKSVLEKMLKTVDKGTASIIAIVSDDINLEDPESYIWGIFTRFDCERDVLFTKQKLLGISPVYEGVLGIDATWKKGYPEILRMDPAVVATVDRRWNEYWN